MPLGYELGCSRWWVLLRLGAFGLCHYDFANVEWPVICRLFLLNPFLQYNYPPEFYSRFGMFFVLFLPLKIHACFLSISTTLALAPRTVSALDLPP
jgi:hypothetical protein